MKRTPKPIRKIRSNIAPFVLPLAPGASVGPLGYDALVERRNALFAQPVLIDRLIRLSGRETSEPSQHVEQQIYHGFPSAADTAAMARFHAAPWCDRFMVVEQFQDPRYRTLGLRLIYAHCPESLPSDIRHEQATFVAARVMGHAIDAPPWSTLDQMDEEAAQLEQEGNADLAEMLAEFRKFVTERKQQAMSVLGLS